jgi:hypothetical protein
MAEPSPISLSGIAEAPTPTPNRIGSFANTVRKLNAGDRDGRDRKRLGSGRRRTTPPDRAMVLLDDIVQVLAGLHLTLRQQRSSR